MNKFCFHCPCFILVSMFEKSENSKSPAGNRQGSTVLCTEKPVGVSEKDKDGW